MFRLTIKELAAKKLRLLTTAMAVLLGVAFLAGTLVLTDTVDQDLRQRPRRRQRRHRRLRPGRQPARPRLRRAAGPASTPSLVDRLRAGRRRRPRSRTKVNGYAQIVDKNGKLVGDATNVPMFGSNWVDGRRAQPVPACAGHAPAPTTRSSSTSTRPTRPGTRSATARRCSPRASRGRSPSSGIAKFGDADSAGGASSVLFTDATAQAVARRARQGRRHRRHRRRRRVAGSSSWPPIDAVVGDDVEVDHRREARRPRTRRPCTRTSRRSASSCWSSPASRCSSVRSSSTTRSRSRWRSAPGDGDAAGDRCQPPSGDAGGARSRPSVVGLVASALGLVAGIGVATVLKALLGVRRPRHPERSHRSSQPSTIVVSLAVGVVVTLVSALLPARRAAKVAPIAALRDVALDRSAASKRRTVTGLGARRRSAWRRCSPVSSGSRTGARRPRCGRGVHRRLGARSGARPPGRLACSVPAGQAAGHGGVARPAERDAQPQAHGPHRGVADDRRRAGRLHHDLRRLGEDLDGRLAREGLPRHAHRGLGRLRRHLRPQPRAGRRRCARPRVSTTVAEQRVTQAEVDGTLGHPVLAPSTRDHRRSCSTSARRGRPRRARRRRHRRVATSRHGSRRSVTR